MKIFILMIISVFIYAEEMPIIQNIGTTDTNGQWALSSDWMGYMGVGLFISNNDYSISFYSDVIEDGKPYPHVGNGKMIKSDSENTITLLGNDIYMNIWHVVKYENNVYLIDKSNLDHMVTNDKVDKSRFLSKVANDKVMYGGQMVMNVPIEIKNLPFPK